MSGEDSPLSGDEAPAKEPGKEPAKEPANALDAERVPSEDGSPTAKEIIENSADKLDQSSTAEVSKKNPQKSGKSDHQDDDKKTIQKSGGQSSGRESKKTAPKRSKEGRKGDSKKDSGKGKDGQRTGRKGGKKDSNKPGLFHDLEGVEQHLIEEMLREVRTNIRANEQSHSSLKEERRQQLDIVKPMRGALGEMSAANSEVQTLIKEIRKVRKDGEAARKIRDEINNQVPPMIEQIEENLLRYHGALTEMHNDLVRIPRFSLEREIFQKFFEHQEMHRLKLQSESAHEKQFQCRLRMGEISKKIDSAKAKHSSAAEDKLADVPHASPDNAGWKEVKRLSERINEIDSLLDTQRKEIRLMRRERGRLEAYLRLLEKGSVGNRVESLADVKERARDGGSLSLGDFDALLSSGGLSSLTEEKPKEESSGSSKQPARKKRGRSGPVRGGPRRHSLTRPERDERR